MKNIAIDGPAGAGKTTISKILSNELNISYIDTGAMYRAIAFYFNQKKIDINDFEKIKKDINLSFDKTKIILNNEDISNYIRTNEISQLASIYSTNEFVRNFLTIKQKQLSDKQEVIMEGRDITTVVLPNSPCKIYLDASLEERTKRRLKQNNQGLVHFIDVYKEIKERDLRDTTRKIAPLTKTNDSLYIDSTNLSIEEVKQLILNKWNNL